MSGPEALARVWERMDLEQPRFSADEVGTWPEGTEDVLIDAGLVGPTDNAASVLCDACAGGHVEEVLYIRSPPGSDPRAYISCPECGRVRVPLERLRRWQVDFDGLASAVASGLDLAGTVQSLIPERLWQLGTATLAGPSRDVFLGRGLGWPDAPQVLSNPTFQAARFPLVFVPGAVPPDEIWQGDRPPLVALKSVTEVEGGLLAVDRNHLESLLSSGKREAPVAPVASFPTPAGACWSDVFIVVADFNLQIEVRGKSRRYAFQEVDFENRKERGKPDQDWQFLTVFAQRGGVLATDDEILDAKARNNQKQYVSKLRDKLRALIPNISGDPIPFNDKTRCYRTAFGICTAEVVGFPTPAGTKTWIETSDQTRGALAG